MANISKITQNGTTVYPQTITDAIADVSRKKTLPNILTGLEGDGQLQKDVTVAAAVGKVPAGSTYSKGTPMSTIMTDILSYALPTFQRLLITDGTNTYESSANVFCSSTAIAITGVKHGETNTDYIKNKQITLNVNGTTSTVDATTMSSLLPVSSSSEGAFIRTSNKASFYVSLNGTTSLNAPMSERKIVLTAYMPVYCFISPTQAESEINGAFISATSESTIYTGTHSIVKTGTFSANSAWCVALPSHLTMTGIGTEADFGFGTQKTSTTTYTATKTVNGISSVPYTIYVLPIDTAQTNLSVKITTKAK
jgi:hypothetical protein